MPEANVQDKSTAAFFDLDLTLLSVNSAKLWLRFMWQRGELSLMDAIRSASWLIRYRLATLDIADVSRKVMRGLDGKSEEDLRLLVEDWYVREVRPHYFQQGRDLVEKHRAQGHRLVLLTGSSPYISAPVCQELRLDDYLCTRLEVVDGRFTGRPVEPVCYGDGKLYWASEFAAEHGVDLDRSWFYTDSFTDLPMLRSVGHPVAVNPDPRLRRLATREGMQVLDFSS